METVFHSELWYIRHWSITRSNDEQVSGKVTYNGHEMNEFVPERTAAYISQHDLHIGEMTVRETLEFSARCQGVGTRFGMTLPN